MSPGRTGRASEAIALLNDMKNYVEKNLEKEGCIDYFATSLPLLLVFEEDVNQLHKEGAEQLLQLAETALAEFNQTKTGVV